MIPQQTRILTPTGFTLPKDVNELCLFTSGKNPKELTNVEIESVNLTPQFYKGTWVKTFRKLHPSANKRFANRLKFCLPDSTLFFPGFTLKNPFMAKFVKTANIVTKVEVNPYFYVLGLLWNRGIYFDVGEKRYIKVSLKPWNISKLLLLNNNNDIQISFYHFSKRDYLIDCNLTSSETLENLIYKDIFIGKKNVELLLKGMDHDGNYYRGNHLLQLYKEHLFKILGSLTIYNFNYVYVEQDTHIAITILRSSETSINKWQPTMYLEYLEKEDIVYTGNLFEKIICILEQYDSHFLIC